ncbi:MAG: hypothetical protein PHQ32_06515 [Firmicutes bacterium]|nr:hypothetical protein [Bacillota bacterium]
MADKIPFYDIVNRLLTGLIFIGCLILINNKFILDFLSPENLEKINFGSETIMNICFLAIIYEIGMIINRLGSVVVEYLTKKIKLIKFDDDYKKYCDSREKYQIHSTLSREYALSRTSFTLFFITSIFAFVEKNIMFGIIFILLAILFLLSYRKYSVKIFELI